MELALESVILFDLTGMSHQNSIVTFGDGVVFAAASVPGAWFSDGTTTGTRQIYEGVKGSEFYVAGDGIYFRCPEGLRWTVGTRDSTRLLSETQGVNEFLGSVGLFFRVDDVLWHSSSGDPSNTRALYRFPLQTANASPQHVGRAGERQIFFTTQGQLVSTDGDSATELLAFEDFAARATHQTVRRQVADRYFFHVNHHRLPDELWVTDGTLEGTRSIRQFDEETGDSRANHLVQVGDAVYFAAHSNELWITDGFAAGTRPIHEFEGQISRILRRQCQQIGTFSS